MLIKDHTGFQLTLVDRPERIVSLVPSQTELLADLGLNDRVLGLTRFCVHPDDWRKTKVIVGGTKNVDMRKLELLKPDLVIGNKEENDRAQIEAIRTMAPVFTTDVKTLQDALNMIADIGLITDASGEAAAICNAIKSRFRPFTQTGFCTSCAYLIWQNPIMTVSTNTFIHDMLRIAGFENVFANFGSARYPEITIDDLISKKPQVILLSSEPYPFRKKHLDFFAKYCPGSSVAFADGEMFSWYGSRLVKFDPMPLRKSLDLD
jgi:ABC-type Fe3+-hydroxamate transport system substrate-binding protein